MMSSYFSSTTFPLEDIFGIHGYTVDFMIKLDASTTRKPITPTNHKFLCCSPFSYHFHHVSPSYVSEKHPYQRMHLLFQTVVKFERIDVFWQDMTDNWVSDGAASSPPKILKSFYTAVKNSHCCRRLLEPFFGRTSPLFSTSNQYTCEAQCTFSL